MKIDKSKVYAFIGRAVVYTTGWALAVAGMFYTVTNCITVY